MEPSHDLARHMTRHRSRRNTWRRKTNICTNMKPAVQHLQSACPLMAHDWTALLSIIAPVRTSQDLNPLMIWYTCRGRGHCSGSDWWSSSAWESNFEEEFFKYWSCDAAFRWNRNELKVWSFLMSHSTWMQHKHSLKHVVVKFKLQFSPVSGVQLQLSVNLHTTGYYGLHCAGSL